MLVPDLLYRLGPRLAAPRAELSPRGGEFACEHPAAPARGHRGPRRALPRGRNTHLTRRGFRQFKLESRAGAGTVRCPDASISPDLFRRTILHPIRDWNCGRLLMPFQRRDGNLLGSRPSPEGCAMVTGTIDLKRERREARDGPAQGAHGRGFSPLADGEEDSAIKHMRMLGVWSARTIFLIEIADVVVFVIGFASLGNTSDRCPTRTSPSRRSPHPCNGADHGRPDARHPRVRSEASEALHPSRTRVDDRRRGFHHRRPLRSSSRSLDASTRRRSPATHGSSARMAINVLRDQHRCVGRVLRIVAPVRRTCVCS